MKINDKYLPLWADEEYEEVIVSGGRGSAKSFTVQLFLCDLTYEAHQKIISSRYTMTSIKTSIIPEFINKFPLLESPYNTGQSRECDFEVLADTVTNKHSQSKVMFMGIKTSSGLQTAKLKSIEGITCLLWEEAEEIPDDGDDVTPSTFDKIDDSIRTLNARLRKILIWNPSDEHSFVYKRFFKGKGENGNDLPINFNGRIGKTLYIYTTYEDNIDNLAEKFKKKAEETKNNNPARYNHIYLGYPKKDVEGALWRQATMIDPYRVFKAPEFKRIVVGVDPSVRNTGKQDECGIVVCGMDFQNPPHFYCIKDSSGILSTGEWTKICVGEYKNNMADRIVPEINNGGDLVIDAIKNHDKNVPCKSVHASRGKMTRAEPISGLAEEGRIHHIGRFPELEQQLTTYDGTGDSPGRYDAYVWAMTELSQNEIVPLRFRSL